MSDPDKLADDARRTQDSLRSDVTRLTQRVNPEKFVGARRQKVSATLSSVKDQVMGAKGSVVEEAKGRAKSAADSAQNAGGDQSTSEAVRDQTQGNPIAAGLIAFGAGWLASSLLPASDAEKKAASTVEEHVAGPVKQSAQDVAGNLKEPAQQAARSVQETTEDAANRTSEHAKSAGADVQGHAQDAKDDVAGGGTRAG